MAGGMKVAVISDTHGLLRAEVAAALKGYAHIIHAGDVGKIEVLERLRALAPIVIAVRGNVDRGVWAEELPLTETVSWQGTAIHVVHARADFRGEAFATRPDVVICGHSHQPSVELENGILHLNPGSVGPRRFRLPISMAWLHIEEGVPPKAELFTFEP